LVKDTIFDRQIPKDKLPGTDNNIFIIAEKFCKFGQNIKSQKMERIAVFPGSFDPFTLGHEAIVRRAMDLFDKIIIAIGINPDKKFMFPIEKRKEWIEKIFAGENKISVDTYSSLTVDYCRSIGAKYILRGLRTSSDFEYERLIGQVNRQLGNNDIETVYLLTLPEHTFISSSVVREILNYNGDISKFVPQVIVDDVIRHK